MRRHSEAPRFHQRGEESPGERSYAGRSCAPPEKLRSGWHLRKNWRLKL